MKKKYKVKTFLYYFSENNGFLKLPSFLKIAIYVLLNIFILFNPYYYLNIILSLFIFMFLCNIGFVAYRVSLFKVLCLSLFLFFVISFLLQWYSLDMSNLTLSKFQEILFFVSPFLSKWLIINLSGLLLFVLLSQSELIKLLTDLKINFKILISITIAFNMIGRLLEAIEDMNMSLNSRGIKRKGLVNLFKRIKCIFMAMVIDNIEYISLLRATYAFDFKEIKKEYEK